MKITISLYSNLGKFESRELDMKREEYEQLIKDNQKYFDGSYELPVENGHMIFSPNIIKESIMEIKIVKKHVAE